MSDFVRIREATVINLDQVARVSIAMPNGVTDWRATFEAVVGGSTALVPLVTVGNFATQNDAAEFVQDVLSGSYSWQSTS